MEKGDFDCDKLKGGGDGHPDFYHGEEFKGKGKDPSQAANSPAMYWKYMYCRSNEMLVEKGKNHKEELEAIQSSLKRQEEELNQQVIIQSKEIESLKGRLEESRNSRDAELEETRLMKEKYNAAIRNAEDEITKYRKQLEHVQINYDHLEEMVNVNLNHEEELRALQSALQRQEQEYSQQLTEQASEISSLKECKEALKKSRDAEIEEKRQMRKKYDARIRLAEEEITSYKKQLEVWQKGQSDLEELVKVNSNSVEELRALQNVLKKQEEKFSKQVTAQAAEIQSLTERLEVSRNSRAEEFKEKRQMKKECDAAIKNSEEEMAKYKRQLEVIQRGQGDLEELVKAKEEELCAIKNILKKQEEKFSQQVTAQATEIESLTGRLTETTKSRDAELEEKNKMKKQYDTANKNSEEEIARYKRQIETFKKAQSELEELIKVNASNEEKICTLQNTLTRQKQEFTQQVTVQASEIESLTEKLEIMINSRAAEIKEKKQLKKDHDAAIKSTEQEIAKNKAQAKLLEDVQQSYNESEERVKEKCLIIEEKDRKIAQLSTNVSLLKDACKILETQLGDFEKVCSQNTDEKATIKEESSRIISEFVKVKKNNIELTDALQTALDKGHNYKQKMESAQMEVQSLRSHLEERDKSELILKSAIEQHAKLIEHLRLQNDNLLSSKKKKGGITNWIFGRDTKEDECMTTPIHVTSGNLNTTCSAPGATPRRILQEHNVVKDLEEEARRMKKQLELLKQKELATAAAAARNEVKLKKENISPVKKEELVLLHEENSASTESSGTQDSQGDTSIESEPPFPISTNIVKSKIFMESSVDEKLYINCAINLFDDIYLLGCEEGLYSARQTDPETKVRIDGVDAIYQIELLFDLNYAVMIEGEERELILIHLGLLRACAEAAACSKPKVQMQLIGDLDNCIEFKIKETSDELLLVVSTERTLNILYWDKNTFKLKKTLKTPNGVTGICITPNSLLFGNDNEKIFEIDLRNFEMNEFMDQSDQTLSYILATNRELHTFPLAILDVGKSGLRRGETTYTSEYLLCFPEVAVFVDSYGRRSREVNLIWSKLPISVVYAHPYLYVLHFGSVEIIRLSYDSFTTVRIGLNKNSVGENKEIIPESRFVQLSNPRLLGNGQNGSIIVGSFEKSLTEVFEIVCGDQSC